MREPFVFLDDSRPGTEHIVLFSDPVGVIEARSAVEIDPAMEALAAASENGFFAAGYFAYELCYALEPRLAGLMPPQRTTPLLWFGLFRSRKDFFGADAAAFLNGKIEGRAYAGRLRLDETEAGYAAKFARVHDYIAAGDVYQVNLTFQTRFAFAGDSLALYVKLRGQSKSGHGAYIDDGERRVLSLSPELFFSIENGIITTRPMKGTAPRSEDRREDLRLAASLSSSEKDRAENLMIVDLIRNDVGRVAQTGTVRVADLFSVETYPTVHQMVSTVRGELRPGTTPEQLIRALFPCGSVTGAPKLRAIEIIRELENVPRGLYCGAIGSFSPGGSAVFNVAIRTLTIQGDEGRLGIGGGIVADSKPGSEYEECLIKARFFEEGRPPLSLIETLRHDKEGFIRLHLHFARLQRSAAALGIPFDKGKALLALTEAVRGANGPLRVRLQLDEDGAMHAAAQIFAPPAGDTTWRYIVSPHRLQSTDVLQRYKTSWRDLYDQERAAANKIGCDEVIYLNERDELVEGSTTNLFARIDGSLVTPAASCGPLDGCLRRALLDGAECAEAILTLADLDGREVYLGNSLRGLIRAVPFGT